MSGAAIFWWDDEPPALEYPPGIPGYWMNETSGVLQPAVAAFVNHDPLTRDQIAALRAYCRQWIAAPVWMGQDVAELRLGVDGLIDRAGLSNWIDRAAAAGCDPL